MSHTSIYQREFKLVEIDSVSEDIIELLLQSKIWCFEGEMGAGKTTLIASLCKNMGSDDAISSPTYSIINEYDLQGKTLVHMDLFRLKDFNELINIDFEKYIDSGQICFIEWFQIAKDLLEDYYLLSIKKIREDKRLLEIHYYSK
jgi:tRNA threonylcarbamoyladenosine biosynthesis protein TsaE